MGPSTHARSSRLDGISMGSLLAPAPMPRRLRRTSLRTGSPEAAPAPALLYTLQSGCKGALLLGAGPGPDPEPDPAVGLSLGSAAATLAAASSQPPLCQAPSASSRSASRSNFGSRPRSRSGTGSPPPFPPVYQSLEATPDAASLEKKSRAAAPARSPRGGVVAGLGEGLDGPPGPLLRQCSATMPLTFGWYQVPGGGLHAPSGPRCRFPGRCGLSSLRSAPSLRSLWSPPSLRSLCCCCGRSLCCSSSAGSRGGLRTLRSPQAARRQRRTTYPEGPELMNCMTQSFLLSSTMLPVKERTRPIELHNGLFIAQITTC